MYNANVNPIVIATGQNIGGSVIPPCFLISIIGITNIPSVTIRLVNTVDEIVLFNNSFTFLLISLENSVVDVLLVFPLIFTALELDVYVLPDILYKSSYYFLITNIYVVKKEISAKIIATIKLSISLRNI